MVVPQTTRAHLHFLEPRVLLSVDAQLVNESAMPDVYDIAFHRQYAYVSQKAGVLQIFSTEDPAHPVRVGTLDLPGSYRATMDIVGDVGYVAAWDGGLTVLDLSSPASPRVIGFYASMWNARNIEVQGNYAYVDDWGEKNVWIIDISKPATPHLAGRYHMSDSSYDGIEDIAVSGNYVYIAARSRGVEVLDVTNHAAPVLVAQLPMSRWAYAVEAVGGYLYASNGSTFNVYDIKHPTGIQRVGQNIAYGAWLEVSDGFAYVSYSDRLTILDVSEPTSPRIAASCVFDGAKSGFSRSAVSGSFVYITDETTGIRIVQTTGAERNIIVEGTAGADYVWMSSKDGILEVHVNAAVRTYARDAVQSIRLDLGGGDDEAHLLYAEDIPATVLAGDGDDTIRGGLAAEWIDGMDGNDWIHTRGGNDTVFGGPGQDGIWTSGGDDVIHGGSGGDYISGGEGNDRLLGEAGNDRIFGYAGYDYLAGMAGRDSLVGGDGADSLFGGADADTLWGEAGLDALHGGLGNDTLVGGLGMDTLLGEDGDDRIYANDGQRDTIRGGAGTDMGVLSVNEDVLIDDLEVLA